MKLIYPNDSRKLRQLITWLLKSWLAQEVQRMNYIKSYTLVDNKVSKQEIKLLEIIHPEANTEKIQKLIAKNRPEAKII